MQINNFPFLLSPKVQKQAEPYLQHLTTELYVENPATNTCHICKQRRIRRTFAEGDFGENKRPCKICLDYCPKCHRIKASSTQQMRTMARITNIRPLDPSYVYFEHKLAEERSKGRTTFTFEELNSWRTSHMVSNP